MMISGGIEVNLLKLAYYWKQNLDSPLSPDETPNNNPGSLFIKTL